jgi:flagellar protein FliO/FliZ
MVDINQVTKILIALFIVMLIMLIITYVLKRAKVSNYLGNKGITIISNLFLGNKERLLLLDVEDQRALIGVTAHSMQTLLILDKKASDLIKKQTINEPSKFQKILRHAENKE